MHKTIRLLADALRLGDRRLSAHCHRVAAFAGEVAAELGLADKMQDAARDTGLLHDIGYLRQPDLVNLKGHGCANEMASQPRPGHSQTGAEIVEEHLGDHTIAVAIRNHDTRFDTEPTGQFFTSAEALLARIVAVCNRYDAVMAGEFLGERRCSSAAALETVRSEADKSLDPNVVTALGNVLNRCPILYGSDEGPTPGYTLINMQAGFVLPWELRSNDGSTLLATGEVIKLRRES